MKFTTWMLTTLLLLVAQYCQAASVWQVSKNNEMLYLGGTLHLLSASDHPLPSAYQKAYQDSQKLVFETDMEALKSVEFGQATMALLTYQDGRTLRDTLNQETFNLLAQHLQMRGVPFANIAQFKPQLVSVTLSTIELQRYGLTAPGVDATLFEQGKADNKTLDWFESPDEQLQFIARMGEEDVNALIHYTLEDLKVMPTIIEPLKDSWRRGDMTELSKLSLDDFAEQYPEIYQGILVQRNRNWWPKLQQLLATPETEFVLVGTLHLPGPDGLLTMLEKAGYTIKQMH